MWYNIVLGILSGIAFASSGYLKSLRRDGKYERFDPYKFGQTLIVGALAGFISHWMGWTLEVAQQFVLNTGMVALIENVKKWLWRKYIKPILLW